MDYWIIKAEAEREDGSRGVISVKFSERDSESTSDEECAFMLTRAAEKQKVKIVGPIKTKTDWKKHAEKDAERTANRQIK
jgi:hypothetical protein